MNRLQAFLRDSFRNDPANAGCAVMAGGAVLLALIVVLAQATDGWLFAAALLVFPLWLLLRNRIG